MALKIVVLN